MAFSEKLLDEAPTGPRQVPPAGGLSCRQRQRQQWQTAYTLGTWSLSQLVLPGVPSAAVPE